MKHLMSLPDLNKVPTPFKPVLAKALAKDPQHRHQTAAELVKDVETIFGEAVPATPKPAPPKLEAKPVSKPFERPRIPQAIPVARPVGKAVEIPLNRFPHKPVQPEPLSVVPAIPFRVKIAELAGSMTLSVVFAAVATTLLAALRLSTDWTAIGTLFFLTVAVCWAVLIPSKFWAGKTKDESARRLTLMAGGALIGLGALWLDGWSPDLPSLGDGPTHAVSTTLSAENVIPIGAGYVAYFGLVLGLLRWWKVSDRRRDSWFSFFPVLATGIWSAVLLPLWPWSERPYGIAALVMASMIVQWVSPWQAPPPPAPRKLKLRRA